MSTNIFFDAQALNPGVKIVAGTFKPNGTSAIDNTVNKGAGWTVARTAVGKFIVTLDSVYPGLLSAQVSLQHNGAGDKKVHWGAIDIAAKTLEIFSITTASAADLAAHAQNHVHFVLFLRNTSQTK
jgi:hypothetical protein|tara:strand:- start:503 stop:880 length:378 start_codon:yes stop_codon:yes gene_type:complete